MLSSGGVRVPFGIDLHASNTSPLNFHGRLIEATQSRHGPTWAYLGRVLVQTPPAQTPAIPAPASKIGRLLVHIGLFRSVQDSAWAPHGACRKWKILRHFTDLDDAGLQRIASTPSARKSLLTGPPENALAI